VAAQLQDVCDLVAVAASGCLVGAAAIMVYQLFGAKARNRLTHPLALFRSRRRRDSRIDREPAPEALMRRSVALPSVADGQHCSRDAIFECADHIRRQRFVRRRANSACASG
jgi:hypothetical protein